jgi:hypothetical protein
MGSLFFWRDRAREVDFVVDVGGRLELFEAKWTEVPAAVAHLRARLRWSCYLVRTSSWINRSTSRASTPRAIAAVGNCEQCATTCAIE